MDEGGKREDSRGGGGREGGLMARRGVGGKGIGSGRVGGGGDVE